MGNRCSAIVAFLALFPFSVSGQSHATERALREPHEWTVQDRIAARVDPQLARARVDREERDRSAHAHLSTRAAALPQTRPALDVIRGSVHPELFLPTELFDSLIRRGFVGVAAWREIHARDIVAAGLPSTFWDDLAEVAAPMIADVRQQHAALLSTRENPHLRDRLERQVAQAYPALCRDRAAALRNARRRFGSALDRFLYTSIAAGMSISTDEAWNSNALLQQEEGCQ